MSAPSRPRFFVLRCPDCGQQVSRPEDERQDGHVGHWHPTFSRWVKAEEVEVIPVDSLLSNGGRVLTISEEAFKELDRKWSRPVEACIKDDELWFRNAASENPESTEEGL